MENDLIIFPKDDDNKRTFIAKKGENNLLIISSYPCTSDDNDIITKNANIVAKENGYDGWIIAYLYPIKVEYPLHYQYEVDKDLMYKNWLSILALITRNQFKIKDVLIAWGNDIELENLFPLRVIAYKMLKDFQAKKLNVFVISMTFNNHPEMLKPKEVNYEVTPIADAVLKPLNFSEYYYELTKHGKSGFE